MLSNTPGLFSENAEKSLALASALFPHEEWVYKEPGIWVARKVGRFCGQLQELAGRV